MSTTDPITDKEPTEQATFSRRSRGGAYGIRGFHYQHVYGMLLAVKSYFGLFELEKIVPEGSDDYEVHTSQGMILIDTKTSDEQGNPRTVKRDAESLKEIWNKATRDRISVNEFQLVLNRGHKSYNLSNSRKAVNLTDHKNFRDILDDETKFDQSYIIVEEDPFSHAVRLVSKKLNVLSAIANIVCSQVTHRIIDAAISNRHRSPTHEASLSKEEIRKVITNILHVCQNDKVEKLLRTGQLRECDYTPAPVNAKLFLNVDVRLGHVTSGQVIQQDLVVESLQDQLESSRSCFIVGPSGLGKSALMWQVVASTRHKVCWYEVSTKSEFDASALTKFLRAASHNQQIGFVIDDVGSGKSGVLDQLILNTQGNENVWILGSIRVEDLRLSTNVKMVSTFHYRPDINLAAAIFKKLNENGLAKNSNWRDAWKSSDPLLMEYMYLLTNETSLREVVFDQIQSRLVGDETTRRRREDELDVLRTVLPVVSLGGRVDFATLRAMFRNESSNSKFGRFPAIDHRTEIQSTSDYRLARALAVLTDELVSRDRDNDEVFGLHDIRTKASIEALITLGCLSRKDLAETAIKYANINTIEHVSFRVISEGLMTKDEIVQKPSRLQIRNEDVIDYWTKIGIGIYRGLLQEVVNGWYNKKFLKSDFPPSLATAVVFSPPFSQEIRNQESEADVLPQDIKDSAQILSYLLFEKIDSILLPHLIITGILNSFRLHGSKLHPKQINEALSVLVGIKLDEKYLKQLKKLKFNFRSFCIYDVAVILDTALAISPEVQEAWIESYERSSVARPLVSRLSDETLFALPIIVTEGDNSSMVRGNFADCILLASTQQIESTDSEVEEIENGRNRHIGTLTVTSIDGQDVSNIAIHRKNARDIDLTEVMKVHWDRIKSLIPNVKHFTSNLIDINGNASQYQESFEIENDSSTLAMKKHSEIVVRAIERNYFANDWMSFLEQEEKLLNRLFELCLEHLDRMTLGINSYDNKMKEFLELTDRADSLLPPDRKSDKNDDTFNYSPPLKSVVKMIGYPLIRRLYFLPATFEEIMSDLATSLRDLQRVRDEPWELSSFNPAQILDSIEEFLKTIRKIALEANRTGSNPLRQLIESFDDSQDRAFSILTRKAVNDFNSYLEERQQNIKKSLNMLFPNATVTLSEYEPNIEFHTKYVIQLPLIYLSEWTTWFTNASSIVKKLSEIFDPKEDFSIIPVINDKYGVAYRWERQLEIMRLKRIEKTGEIFLERNRFLLPNKIPFENGDYAPAVPNLTVYEDFIRLCSVNSFIFGKYDGSHNLDKEFDIRNLAVAKLENSYSEFRPFVESTNNKALFNLCRSIEQVLSGRNIMNRVLDGIDPDQLVAGFAEVIWRNSST